MEETQEQKRQRIKRELDAEQAKIPAPKPHVYFPKVNPTDREHDIYKKK